MDNLKSHKGPAIRAAIRAAGALLLILLAYSPDPNPIEQVFAKIKTLLHKADARSIKAIDAALGALLHEFDSLTTSETQVISQPQANVL